MAQAQKTTTTRKPRAPKAAITSEAVQKVLEGGTQPVDPMQREAEEAHNRRAEDQRRRQNDAVAVSAQQVLAPAHTEAEVDQSEVEKFQRAVQVLADTMGIPKDIVQVAAPTAVVAAEQPQPAQKDVRNGITRPAPGTKTGRIWDAADEITVNKRAAASIAELRAVLPRDVNEHTLKTQYARWRSYHGVTGRVAPNVQGNTVVGEDEGIAEAHNRRATDLH